MLTTDNHSTTFNEEPMINYFSAFEVTHEESQESCRRITIIAQRGRASEIENWAANEG